jgi:hypothetical protein
MTIKDRINKARSKLSIKTYKRPQLFIISMMLLLNIMILVIAALIALLIDDGFSNFIDAFANGSVKWMLTPNAILLIENPRTLVLAVIVLIIGMVLFTGTIIALTTNAIKDYFQKKKSGSGKLILDKQIVILNWNNKVPELVADLIHLDKEDISIVILADIDKSEAEKLITNAIKNIKKDKSVINLNILVKQGNPLIKTDLYDVSIEKAQTILIMNIDDDNTISDPSLIDLNLIKTILNLGEIKFIYHPPIVAEIRNIASKDKVIKMSKVVKSLEEHTIIPICFDRRLGHVIAQTIINPLIKRVYLSMFSFDDAEVYFLDHMDIDTCLQSHSHVIPIAKHKDGLFVLSEKEQQLHLKADFKDTLIPLKTKTYDLKTDKNITIIGSNNKLQFIKESFDDYTSIYQSQFKVNYINDDDVENSLDTLKDKSNEKTILLLSKEDIEPTHLDANIINNLIFLQSHLNQDTNIIVEVLDPSNDHIIKDFNIKNTIISNKIISLLVSKIVLYKETAPFYENLLTIKSDVTGKDDQNISIVAANQMLEAKFPLSFKNTKQFIGSFYQAFNKKLMVIGYFSNNQLHMFYGDLHQKQDVTINKDDLLIFIKI